MEKIFCNNCKVETNHEVSARKSIQEIENIEGQIVPIMSMSYEILNCKGCENGTFRITESYPNVFNIELTSVTSKPQNFVRFYPERLNTSNINCRVKDLPFEINRVYLEIITAYNQNQFILMAAGLRVIVEAVCNQCEIPIENTLGKRIHLLGIKRFVSLELSNSLQVHKFLGNQAVHHLEVPTQEELKMAFELVENLLETIYCVPRFSRILKENLTRRIINQ